MNCELMRQNRMRSKNPIKVTHLSIKEFHHLTRLSLFALSHQEDKTVEFRLTGRISNSFDLACTFVCFAYLTGVDSYTGVILNLRVLIKIHISGTLGRLMHWHS